MFDWIRNALEGQQAAVDPYQQFAQAFASECQRQNVLPESYDPQAHAFTFMRDDGAKLTVQLENMFREWLSRDPSGQTELIARFVQSVVEMRTRHEISSDKLPDELMPGIRSHAQISNLMINGWIAGAAADDRNATVFLPFVGDLVACVLRDQPNSIAPMTHANLDVARLSIEQAMQQAMANFRSRLPPPVFEPLGNGVFGCNNLSDHQSALLLLAPGPDYPLPAIDGAPVVAVPSRNLFYLTGSANRPGLSRLLDIAAKAPEQQSHFCSSSLLRWDGNRWIEDRGVGGDDLAARQHEIAQHQLAADYTAQKQLLDQYHDKQGQDIFVANVLLFRPKGSSDTISASTLASGTTGTLLPRTDRLAFIKQIIDPQTGRAQAKADDMATVAWADAMSIAGDLFEQVAYLYPPRFRALGFPGADTWTKLKAVTQRL
jgi:hypothetical protein